MHIPKYHCQCSSAGIELIPLLVSFRLTFEIVVVEVVEVVEVEVDFNKFDFESTDTGGVSLKIFSKNCGRARSVGPYNDKSFSLGRMSTFSGSDSTSGKPCVLRVTSTKYKSSFRNCSWLRVVFRFPLI